MELHLQVKPRDLERILTKLNRLAPKNQVDSFQNAWHSATRLVTNALIRNVSGKILNRRTGALAQMQYLIDKRRIQSIIGNRVISGNPVPYTAIHEYGGTIRPKRGKYLFIPIRKGSREALWLVNERRKTLAGAGLRVSKKTGRLTGVSHSTNIIGGRLVKQVRIPARRYVSKTIEEATPQVTMTIEKWIEKEINK